MNMMPSFLGYCALRYVRRLHRLHSCTQHSASHPRTYVLVCKCTHTHTHSTSLLCPYSYHCSFPSQWPSPLWLQVHAEASTPVPVTNVASDSLRKSPKQRGITMPKLPPSKPNLEQGIKTKADIMRAMIKRRLETVEDAHHHIGHRKRARVQNRVSHLHLTEFQSLT